MKFAKIEAETHEFVQSAEWKIAKIMGLRIKGRLPFACFGSVSSKFSSLLDRMGCGWKHRSVPVMMDTLLMDIRRTYDTVRGSRARKIVACIRSPGVEAVIAMRFGQWLLTLPAFLRVPLTPIYVFLDGRVKSYWGIEISRQARIGPGFYIGHFGGITISPQATIGADCNISQGVTIGVSGEGEKWGAPLIGNNVYLAAGAKLFGKIRIGNNVKIGANAVVYKDVPDNALVVVDPGFKIISFKGNSPRPSSISSE